MSFDYRGAARTSAKGPLCGRPVTGRSSSRAVLFGLALVVGSLVLAAPAQGEPAARSGGAAQDQAAIVVDAGRGAVLPFARLDLAILALGGAVLVMAAASAPILFRPLPRPALLFARAAAAAREPLVAGAEEATPLRATA